MYRICNAIMSFFYYIVFYIINIYIWFTYATIQSFQIYKYNNKVHLSLKKIYLYSHSITFNYVDIVYYYNYKSVIHLKNGYVDCKHLKQTTPTPITTDTTTTALKDISNQQYDNHTVDNINENIETIKSTVQLLRLHTKCIITNLTIHINSNLKVIISKIIIQPTQDEYTIYISSITIHYRSKKISTIHKVNVIYLPTTKNIIINIHAFNIKLLHYEVNIKECIENIVQYIIVDGEKSEYTIKIFVHTASLNFNHKNSIQLHLNKFSYDTAMSNLYIDTCNLYSCKKNIVSVHNIIYNTQQDSIINIDHIYAEIYKTTLYKLRLSIDFLIKKNISPMTTNNATLLLKNIDHLEQLIYTDYINDIDSRDTFVNDNNSPIPTIIKKLNININTLHLKVMSNKKYVVIYLHSLSYTKYSKIMYNIRIKNLEIVDHNNNVYIKKKFNVTNKMDITFKNNFLKIFICPLEINLDFDIIKDIINVLEENMTDLKKLLYYEFIKNNYKEYFIHHLFIHTILIDISYYPKKSSLYKNIFSNNKKYSIYNIANYKHIQLSTKEIDIYYPLSTNNLLKKITKIWFQDIYKHQIKNIMRGIKYTKPIPMTYDFSSNVIKHIKTLLKSSVQYLDNV